MPTRTAARPQCGSPWWLAVGSVLDAPAGLEALPASHGLLLDRPPAEGAPA